MSHFETEFSAILSTTRKAQEQLIKSTPQLDHAISNSHNKGLPPISVGPGGGQLLSQLCNLARAQAVLEIGTLGGYSTIWLATSYPGVQVTSIEFDPKHHAVACENTKHLDNVDVRLGAALDVLPKIAAEGKVFDFIFIDADWNEQQQYFDWAVKLTRKGGAIYVDNAVRQLTEPEDDGTPNPKAWDLLDYVKKDDRVTLSLVPVLNTEKTSFDTGAVDGFILAIVK